VSRLPDLDDFLDPTSLTSQQLYTLQSETWAQGADYMREYIINLIRDRVSKAKEYADNGQVTAMQRKVSYEDLEAISEAIIYDIEKETNEL
jgi:hypothetical protein